jgi:hypothetical protein
MAAPQNGHNDIPDDNIPFPTGQADSQSILPRTLTVDQTPQLSRSQTPITPRTPSPSRNAPSQRPSLSSLRTPSIRLRRAPSSFGPSDFQDNETPSLQPSSQPPLNADASTFRRLVSRTRPRSVSDPQFNLTVTSPRSDALSHTVSRESHLNLTQMPTVSEEPNQGRSPTIGTGPTPQLHHNVTVTGGEALHDSTTNRQDFGAREDDAFSHAGSAPPQIEDLDMDSNMVDVLDVVDPEISTLTTLTNMQNSLVIPNLGRWLSRRPIFSVTPQEAQEVRDVRDAEAERVTKVPTQLPDSPKRPEVESQEDGEPRQELTHTSTISSTMVEGHYAVLPRGKRLSGWSPGEKHELDDHVRHMLHSKRSKFKRSMKGFLQYIKKRKSTGTFFFTSFLTFIALGFFVTLYAILITLFGLIWVLFLIGWINVGGKKLYTVNVIDTILVVLFNIMGVGLAPFRAWDTYNAVPIVWYHFKTWRERRKQKLPKLENLNDLPTLREEDVGADKDREEGKWIVLTEKQQEDLSKHQTRYANSHTFYKPHETTTHYAFPILFLIAIQILVDLHSMFQIALGGVTYGINYHKRPFKTTTALLCCSITCNITAGVLISIGDHRTRKKEVIEQMYRQELTTEALRKIEKRRIKEQQQPQDFDEGLEDTYNAERKRTSLPIFEKENTIEKQQSVDDSKETSK